MSAGPEGAIRKAGVSRVKHSHCWRWQHLPRIYKDYHAVGRTRLGLDVLAVEAEVTVLEEQFGTVLVVKDVSLTTRLDFVATEIIRAATAGDRAEIRGRGEVAHPGAHEGVLSPFQWRDRHEHELSFVPEMLDGFDLARREEWRTYRRTERIGRGADRIGLRGHDKSGDGLALRSPIYGVTIKMKGER